MSTPSEDSKSRGVAGRGNNGAAGPNFGANGNNHNAERGILYRWLAFAFQDPARENGDPLRNMDIQEACRSAAAALRTSLVPDNGELARGEVPLEKLNLEPSLDLLSSENGNLIARYDELFGLLLSRDCPPYETEYCPQTFSVYRSNQLADIAGFYCAFGLEPSRVNPERHDHIVLELEFMAWLILKEAHTWVGGRAQICRDAQRRFLEDHLLWWAPAFAFAIRKKSDGIGDESEVAVPSRTFYGATAQLLSAFMRAERLRFGIPPPQQLLPPNPSDEEPDSNSCDDCELLAQ